VADDPGAYQQPDEEDDSFSINDDFPINDEFTLALDLLAHKRREKEADGMNVVFQEIEEQRKVSFFVKFSSFHVANISIDI
jgi:hypothetical protein